MSTIVHFIINHMYMKLNNEFVQIKLRKKKTYLKSVVIKKLKNGKIL